MATSVLEQYRVSDLIEWHERKQLILNPHFQRRSFWSTPAKVYLIDTVLRQLPIPKVYMRTKVDPNSKKSVREVVDGQQRLRAVIEFANDKLTLTGRANEYKGLTYSKLPDDLKSVFLSYPIAVDQLINASDTDVLEIFARLNSYTDKLRPPELRHAEFQGPFKWAVHEYSKKWALLWEKYKVVSVRERLRMADDSLMAEMFGIVLKGVTDGGQPKIRALYKEYEEELPEQKDVERRVDAALGVATGDLGEVLEGNTVSNAPHFLMLFAAVAHALHGIPKGDMGAEMPAASKTALKDTAIACENLVLLNRVLEGDEDESGSLKDFYKASRSSTQRIASRRIRFPIYYRALQSRRLTL